MISGLKPYPAYKDSGVEWLGEVPEHWRLRRMKSLFVERSVKGFPHEPLLAATQTKGVVRKDQYENRTMLALKDLDLLKLVCVGDFVISLRSFQGGIEYAHERGIISPAYTVIYAKDQRMQGFFARLFKSRPFVENLSLYVTGIRQGQNIDYGKLSRDVLPVPPAEEQNAIISFLDYVERRIGRHISSRQKLISLLNEQKQLIINQAATRGLNPDVRLKPSGVEWLGDVPEHWRVVPLKRCLQGIDQGWSPMAAEGTILPDQWAVLSLSSIKKGHFGPSEIKPIPEPTREIEKFKIFDGDLLMTRSNTRELVGDVCIVQGARPRTIISDLIYRLRVDKPLVDARFLMYQLLGRVGRFQAERDARGSSNTMPKISQQRIRSWIVILPPLAEQRTIAALLEERLGRIDRLIQGIHEELGLLREFTTRLVSDVVTGALDVREAAAKLQDESEEPDESDWNEEAEDDMQVDETE